MTLLIVQNKKLFPLNFINNLKTIFKHRLLLLLDIKKLKLFEEHIKIKYNLKNFNLLLVCYSAIDNSLVIEGNDDYTIIIDPNMRINNLKVSSIIKYINDGDLETPPYPIFTEVLNYIFLNLTLLFLMYLMGIVI